MRQKNNKKSIFINKKMSKKHGTYFSSNKNNLMLNKKNIFLLTFSGGIIGLLNGFFGGGGGMVAVPLLSKVLALDSKSSHATAIMVIFPLSLVSGYVYVLNGHISSLPLLTVTIGVAIGGIMGSYALKFLPSKAVQIIFALIMFMGGIKLIL